MERIYEYNGPTCGHEERDAELATEDPRSQIL